MPQLKHNRKYLQNSTQSPEALAFLASLEAISKISPKIAECVVQELKDQRKFLKMIASENYSSLAVQLAMGNLLTDKYSEGYVGRRFYAGCENVDAVEGYANDLAKKLFQAEHAYLQPHSGADANLIAFLAILSVRVEREALTFKGKKLDQLTKEEYEDLRELLSKQKMLGMSLNSGGHLTHGYRHNISSKLFSSSFYDVDPKTGLLDYTTIQKKVLEEKPLILLAGYSAYPRKIDFAKMREIADSVGAVLMVDMAHFSGLVAGGVFTGNYNPVPFADIITSTTHKTLRGPRGGMILCKEEFKDAVNRGCPLVIGGPMPHVIAAKAVAFEEALKPSFQDYSQQVVKNAQALAEFLQKKGVRVLTGGTDNHMLLIDVYESFGLTGKAAEGALRQVGITCNRNSVPNDQNGAWYTSGIRLGTPALTSLGMREEEMKIIAEDILEPLLRGTKAKQGEMGPSKVEVEIDPDIKKVAQEKTEQLTQKYPVYPEIILPEGE